MAEERQSCPKFGLRVNYSLNVLSRSLKMNTVCHQELNQSPFLVGMDIQLCPPKVLGQGFPMFPRMAASTCPDYKHSLTYKSRSYPYQDTAVHYSAARVR